MELCNLLPVCVCVFIQCYIYQCFLQSQFKYGKASNLDVCVCVRTGMLHSNPGDYAWGQGGLDAVITQVVEQDDTCTCYQIRVSVQMR